MKLSFKQKVLVWVAVFLIVLIAGLGTNLNKKSKYYNDWESYLFGIQVGSGSSPTFLIYFFDWIAHNKAVVLILIGLIFGATVITHKRK